ncbi:hypothetical protein ACIBK8_00160 [Streptomyces sp. NPDC050161]|uniref:hypothetical protein n=1 Tax=Streptomyces sp. NPDC050161 TaxID=3365604 RepID=UPI003793BC36
MLKGAWEAAGRMRPEEVVEELEIASSTLRDWVGGRTVPSPTRARDFWSVVGKLQHASGSSTYSDVEWEAALRAAQGEARNAQERQILANRRRANPGLRFVRLHRSAPDTSAVEVRGRTDERTEMNSFVRDSRAEAPSYLCWHADAPVGKTALLADYVCRQPPADTDILTFFVSAAHSTDTRAGFEEEIVDQIDEFLGRSGSPAPSTAREWKALFAEAAAKSARHGRKLLLVVDGLDDDVAWSGLAVESGTPESGAEAFPGTGSEAKSGADATKSKGSAGTGQRPVRGSIAALLPSRPPPGMRVIVSLRRCVRLPADVPPVRHPLRQSRYLRTLVPVAGVPLIRQPPPDTTALGESVAGLLAVAGGGLRTTDLAELTGIPAEHLDRLAQVPAGRALVTDDPVSRTYALADLRLVRAVREDLGEAGVLRHTHELLAWSRRWRAAGWPDGTPPYPLAHQLRLLTDTAERTAYVLDMLRLRRLARTAGPDAAFAQLEAFEAEISGAADATSVGGGLATLVPLCAARFLLRQDTCEVPDGAASLFVRLGDAERARGLARSAPTAVARAVHLADVAVEMVYAGQSYTGRADLDAVAVVREAVEWLARDRAHQGFPGTFRDPESHARLLGAARTLAALNAPHGARLLLRAVLQDPTAGTEVLIEAAGMLDLAQDLDAVAVLHDRAETLSAGGMRARTAAVDLWGALARAAPFLGPYAGDRIEAFCEELGDADGLGAVDVLATAASALIDLPAKRPRPAAELMRKALVRMRKAIEALRDPVSLSDSLSEDDRAHLRRELAGTLERLTKAVADAGVMRDGLDGIRRLMEPLPEELRIGVLGDPLLERAQRVLEAAKDDRARRDSEAAAAADEKRRAERRAKDAERKVRKEERVAWEEERDSPRSTRTGRIKAQAVQAVQTTQAEPEGARRPPPARNKPMPRRSDTHRRSVGLPPPGDGPHPDHSHFPLLLEADDQLGAGNLLRSRELLETALRDCPAAQSSMPANNPPLPRDWTADLCQAMGAAGESDEAEALAQNMPDTCDRARHLAALSLGCSLAGNDDLGTCYAQAAARLVPDGAAPELANVVAQALAHTGDEPAASAMATGGNAAQRRQALTAVAAGLVRHCPEGAARVAGPLVESLAQRIEAGRQGSPRTPLPELAALLLAFPDVRHPAPRLSDALHRAALCVAAPSMLWPTESMPVLTLLARLGCLPDEDTYVVASSTDRWRRPLQPGQEPSAELALLAAVDGDTAAVWRHADEARTPDVRSTTLRTAAAHLAGTQVALATDSLADDRVIRTCLALARTSGDGSPPAEATARHIALRLLRSDAWTYTIPLLPPLAPGALGRLGAIAADMSRHTEGAADGGASS